MNKITIPTTNPNLVREIPPHLILCNNVTFPWENPNKVVLHIISNKNGVLGAVWAETVNEALKILVDEGLGNALLLPKDKAPYDAPKLGFFEDPADLSDVVIDVAAFCVGASITPEQVKLLCLFAEARGAAIESLSDLE